MTLPAQLSRKYILINLNLIFLNKIFQPDYLVIEKTGETLVKAFLKQPLTITELKVKDQNSKNSTSGINIIQVISSKVTTYDKVKLNSEVKAILEQNNNQYFTENITLYSK